MPQASDPVRLGTYEIVRRLGEGGQGVIYLGRDPAGKDVAIKLLRMDLLPDHATRERFVREMEVAKKVARFCTAQVLDADVAGDRPYIVSEYIDGPSLARLVEDAGPRTGGALERLAIATATALVGIHRAGIVHRDFKPQNVLIGSDGARVIDFGIARVLESTSTMASQVIGTPSFMAPEQVAGGSLSTATDVFAWGSTMLFAATGRPPFEADSVWAVLRRIREDQPGLEPLQGELRGLVMDAMDKDPAKRPTARQILDRLLGEELVTEPGHGMTTAPDNGRATMPDHRGAPTPDRGDPNRPNRPSRPGAGGSPQWEHQAAAPPQHPRPSFGPPPARPTVPPVARPPGTRPPGAVTAARVLMFVQSGLYGVLATVLLVAMLAIAGSQTSTETNNDVLGAVVFFFVLTPIAVVILILAIKLAAHKTSVRTTTLIIEGVIGALGLVAIPTGGSGAAILLGLLPIPVFVLLLTGPARAYLSP